MNANVTRIAVVTFGSLFAIGGSAQEWKSTAKTDALTGRSYTSYVLTGKFLTPPTRGLGEPPSIVLQCDPSASHGKISGKFIDGFIVVGTVIDFISRDTITVRYRLDDGKLQTAYSIGPSNDLQAIRMQNIFVYNMLWGHEAPYKPGTYNQVHKFVIGVQEHLAGQVVMEFDIPEVQQVGVACGAEHR